MRLVHQNAVEMIRQNSDNFHLQLMIEKIKVINLEEKLHPQAQNNSITNDLALKMLFTYQRKNQRWYT
jgi:hypothetical protein